LKHLISVTAVLSSMAACSSNSSDNGTGGTTGSGAQGGTGMMASGGHPGTGGTTGTTGGTGQGGTGVSGGTGGSGATSGTGGSGTAGKPSAGAGGSAGANMTAGTGGTGAGTGGSPTGGMPGTGGTGGGSGGVSTGGSGGVSAGGQAGTGAGGSAAGGMSSGGTGAVGPGMSGLPVPPGSADVPKPSGTPGDITVVNWAGFKGAVTYSFDDSNQSQIDHYADLKAAGGQYTFYMWTGHMPMAGNSIWKTALADGHEIANHTQSHDPSGHCTATDVNAATTYIQSNLSTKAWTMAAPNGDTCYKSVANGLFFINRGVSPASPVMPNDSSDALNLNCYIPATQQASSVFNNDVDTARTKGGWVIYVVHGFSDTVDSSGNGPDGSYHAVKLADMTAAIKHSVGLGDMWIGAMVQVASYWAGQKAFKSAMTSTSGTDKTWTWTLPGQFPTGKYLRVTVPGGTLKQNGQVLNWDPHGYYEIALDAKSVTVSP
jgi:hypothetical protein